MKKIQINYYYYFIYYQFLYNITQNNDIFDFTFLKCILLQFCKILIDL